MQQDRRLNALSNVISRLAAISGKGILFAAAMLGAASVVPGIDWQTILSPLSGYVNTNTLALIASGLASGLGVGAMGSLLDRIADSDELSNRELLQEVEHVVAQSEISNILTTENFYHAFAHLRRGQKTLLGQGENVIDSLSKIENRLLQLDADFATFARSMVSTQVNGNVSNSVIITASGDVSVNYTLDPDAIDVFAWLEKYVRAISTDPNLQAWGYESYMKLDASQVSILSSYAEDKGDKRTQFIDDVLLKAFQAGETVLVIGEGGSGKSTTFKRLLFLLANRCIDTSTDLIPVLLPLIRYRGSFLNLVRSGFNEFTNANLTSSQTSAILKNSRFVFLIDGYNELGTFSEEATRDLLEFLSLFPKHRFVISTRPNTYINDLPIDLSFKLQPLSDKQIYDRFENELGADGRAVFTSIRKNAALSQYVSRPLILHMIIDNGFSTVMPSNLGGIYNRFFKQTIWREGQKGRSANSIAPDVKMGILAYLAYEMIDNQRYSVDAPFIKEKIENYFDRYQIFANWRDYLHELFNNGLLIESNGLWTFEHQSYQEYFAALAIEYDSLGQNNLRKLANDNRWRDVLIYLAGITEYGTELVKFLTSVSPIKAADAVIAGAKADDVDLALIVSSIGQLSRSENWTTQRTAADLLGRLGSPYALEYLISMLGSKSFEVRWGAVYSLRLLGDSDAISETLNPLLKDTNPIIQGEAAMALGECQSTDSIFAIADLMKSHHPYPRVAATYALFKLRLSSTSKEGTYLSKHSNPQVRLLSRFSIQLSDQIDLISFLHKNLEAPSSLLKEAAIGILVRELSFKSVDHIGPLMDDPVASVRMAAIGGVGKLSGHKYIHRIEEILHSDSDSLVRQNCVRALQWLSAKESVPALLAQLSSDDAEVRGLSTYVIGLLATPSKPILNEIMRRAKDDESIYVRYHAIRALGFLGGDDVVNFLRMQSKTEKEAEVMECIVATLDELLTREQRIWF